MTDRKVALGNTKNIWFPPQFTGSIDGRSLMVTPIEYYNPDGRLLDELHATGFFYRYGGCVYLVSARHAISGLDPFTNDAFSKSRFLPEKIRVYPSIAGDEFTSRIAIDLDVRENGDRPLWLEDPEFGSMNTDIACIRISHPDQERIACIELAQDENLYSAVGFDCFIVGYPNRNYIAPYLPIWRRGSFAYEPTMPIHDRPMFLVDAATSPGLSGAPIFQRSHGPAPVVEPGGELTIKADTIVATRFVGVYGGRLDHANQLAQIGYGWYANRIPMIIAGKAEHLPGKPSEFQLLSGNFGFGSGTISP